MLFKLLLLIEVHSTEKTERSNYRVESDLQIIHRKTGPGSLLLSQPSPDGKESVHTIIPPAAEHFPKQTPPSAHRENVIETSTVCRKTSTLIDAQLSRICLVCIRGEITTRPERGDERQEKPQLGAQPPEIHWRFSCESVCVRVWGRVFR